MDKENVNKNKHYQFGIETIDYIDGLPESAGFYQGNVIKYVSRYKDKGGVTDLEKAMYYLIKLIEKENDAPYVSPREEALEQECEDLYEEIDMLREWQIAHLKKIAIDPFEDNVRLLDNLGGLNG